MHVRDLHVLDDRLFFARFSDGLWVADIGPDGTLASMRHTGVDGNARMLDDDGERLVLLTQDRGLLVFDGSGDELVQLAHVDVPGPPIDLKVRDHLALVSQGSVGVRIVDLEADPPALVSHLKPPAVATGADVDGDRVAVASLVGTFIYDDATTDPRRSAFHPSRSVLLDVAYAEGTLVLSDWEWVERLEVDTSRPSPYVDVEPGLYLGPGQDARVVVRNPASSSLDLEVSLGGVWSAGRSSLRGRAKR